MNSPTPIQPGGLIDLDPAREQVLRVTEGIVYVMVDDQDVVLTPGDSITIPSGPPRRAWNAGDEIACVVTRGVARLQPVLRAA